METLVQLALTNAVMATLLALVAGLAGLLRLRPALVHGLWLLVLLKLVTPPFVSIPVPAWSEDPRPADGLLLEAKAETPEPIPVETAPLVWLPEEERVLLAEPARAELQAVPFADRESMAAPATGPAASTTPAVAAESPMECCRFALVLWGAGSLLFALVAAIRIVRFQRFLEQGTPVATALAEQVAGLAEQLGLRRVPEVRLLSGAVSPMIWGLGWRTRLLIPAELFARLDDEQRDALLVHELSHLRRGDHWVRLLELVATALFWWHPVLWWARQGLHEAEEQCCDAWVVWALPASARAYAEALLETIDFLSEARPALPPAASGIGQVRKLKRRLTMIMQAKTPHSLSLVGFVVLFCLGVGLLPLVPQLVQADDKPAEVKILVKKLIGDETADFDPEVQALLQHLVEMKLSGKEDEARVVLEKLTRVLQEKKAKRADRDAAARKKEAEIDRARAEIEKAEAQFREAQERLMQAHRKLAELTGARDKLLFLYKKAEDEAGNIRIIQLPPGATPGVRVPTPPPPHKVEVEIRNRDERLNMLERQLAELLREVKALKEEKRGR
ncbi:MAG: M56 family metallopeptidase [Gemmataceae bacterium]